MTESHTGEPGKGLQKAVSAWKTNTQAWAAEASAGAVLGKDGGRARSGAR